MAEDQYTRELFRQAAAFEKLEAVFRLGNPTEKDQVMAQVCNGLAKVCMMLAEEHCNEVEKKELRGSE